MTIRSLNNPPAFGYETHRVNYNGFSDNRILIESNPVKKSSKIQRNLLKIIGYIPVLSIITAAVRLKNISNATFATEAKRDSKARHIARSIFELIGLGSLLLLPDVAITIDRERKAKKIAVISEPFIN